MKLLFIILLGSLIQIPINAQAVECASGPYRAGCAGPNGAAVVRRPYEGGFHSYEGGHACAAGPNRAGCVGPNGAAVVHRPY
jgi:hypothetical protein